MAYHENVIGGDELDVTTDTISAGATIEVTEGDVELAIEARREHLNMLRAHPDLEDQMLHRLGECDGSCEHVEEDEDADVVTSNW